MAARRRTQAERRAETRRRLLEATLACLVSHGYAGTTAERVAATAGLTRGAVAYHFPTMDALLGATLEHLRDRRAEQTVAYVARIESAEDPIGQILDLLWEVFHDEVFVAVIEVWVPARTSADLQAHVADLQPSLAGWVRMVSGSMLGDSAANRAMVDLALTAMDTIRGVLMTGLPGDGSVEVEAEWARARRHLHLLATTEMATHGFTAEDLRRALSAGLQRFAGADAARGLLPHDGAA